MRERTIPRETDKEIDRERQIYLLYISIYRDINICLYLYIFISISLLLVLYLKNEQSLRNSNVDRYKKFYLSKNTYKK